MRNTPHIDERLMETKRTMDMELSTATWNVRTLLQNGKLENVERKIVRYGLSIVGISEMLWKDADDFLSDKVRVIYCGGTKGEAGVEVILDQKWVKILIYVL